MIGILKTGKKKKSRTPLPFWALGRDYVQPGEMFIFQISGFLAGGLAPGNKNCVAAKWEGNEDALGALTLENGTLLLLADSHFGRFAGEQALAQFEEIFQETQGTGEARLFHTLLNLDEWIRAMKLKETPPIHPSCATTLIAAWIVNGTVTWCSVGDSFLWHIRRGEATSLNERTQVFMADSAPMLSPMVEVLETWHGAMTAEELLSSNELWWTLSLINRYVRGLDSAGKSMDELLNQLKTLLNLADSERLEGLRKSWHPWHLSLQSLLPEWGKRRLQQGDYLLLASDGVEERVTGVPLEELVGLVSINAGTTLSKVRQLIQACNGRKGGGDNTCCWLWEQPNL